MTAAKPATQRPLLLFFHSPRSGGCRRAHAFLAQVLQERRNHETFALHELDVDEHADLARRLRIDQVPTILVVAGRRVRARIEEPAGCADLRATLRPWLR